MSANQPKLRDLVQRASAHVSSIFSKDGAIYAPFWHAITSSGRALILAPEIADKDIAVAAVRAAFEQEDVVRYVSIAEAWVLKKKASDIVQGEIERYQKHGVADHPDRTE
jgi:hypothetical protein